MLNVNARAFVIALFLVCFCVAARAQKTLIYDDDIRYYNRAIELFDKEKYGVAQKHFQLFAQVTRDRESRINAEYYAGVCAMELFNADAITLLNNVRTQYPEHPKANLAAFQLGKYFYRNKDNKSAVNALEQVDAAKLTPTEAAEYWFIKGYTLFKSERFDDAKTAFNHIKEQQGKYYDASNYYYGYVSYRQNNYDEALAHFNRISASRTFGPLSQVYVAQIYFSRKQYAQVVAVADTIRNKDIVNDVAGIVGQSYFNLASYEKALPFLEKFNNSSPVGKNKQDIYRLGYAYFETRQYDKAIDQFTQITDDKDSTSQFANYHLAQAYIATDKKHSARLAFEKAYHAGIDPKITEASLFNAAKLSYELSYQQDALRDLASFMNEYPESEYMDEAKADLGNLLLITKNYKDAIRIIESIKKPGRDNQVAFQRVCFYRAEELYLNNDYTGAMELFKKSMQYDYDKKLFALSHFWVAELSYKQHQFSVALEHYNKFQEFAEIRDTRFYSMAYYNKGYCELKLENYTKAIAEFNTFLKTEYAADNPEMYTDASMRVADCYFILREYNKAIESYNLVIDRKLNGADYALYQKAMIEGILNKPSEKIAALEHLKTNYPKSPYIDDALFEIANVNLQTEHYDAAISGFQDIIDHYGRSVYVRRAMLNKGLAYYNTSRDEQALESFKQLITDYSSSEEAKEALVVVKNIFVNKGESEAYIDFIKVLPNVVVSPSYQDSVSYESAFNLYKNGDCTKAARAFGSYINRFPGGYFILKANYYKAECDFKNKQYDSALVNYEYVAAHNRNDFTERSVRQSAVLQFMKKNYEKAYEYYSALERIASGSDNLAVALLGQMKSATLLNKPDTAAMSAFKYLNSTIANKEGTIDARMNVGRYYMLHQQPDSALPHFHYVLKETRNALAAESKYEIAHIQYLHKDYAAAKKSVFELNDNFSAYEYWTASGFILLADIYVAQKDLFQAKATLQSVLENVDDERLKNIAREKLKAIIAQEELQKPKVNPQEEKEIGQ